MATIFNVAREGFYTFWGILDNIFTWINLQFILVFSAIPRTAIYFLIGIFSYSVLAFIMWSIDKVGPSRQRVILKIFYAIYMFLSLMFTIWRLGIIGLIDKKITVYTIGEFLFNIISMLFFIILIIAFKRRVPWLKKALITFLWIMFALFTWVIGPIIGEITLSQQTLQQFLIVAVIFIIPNTMYEYRKARRKSI